jgi:integrase
VRVLLKGVHKVRYRLASGEVATYYYAWRGGPSINAEPGTPEFVRLYTEALAARKRPASGTMMALIAEYKAAAEFTTRAEVSKRNYLHYLRAIESEFGDMPIEALSDPNIRGVFKAWRDSMAASPRKADYAWTTLARVLSVAKDRGRISINPCERGGRIYEADRKDRIWGEAELGRLLASASPGMTLALMLALWTGQRQGDLLRLPWSAYDGKHIRLRQSKTGRNVVVPVASYLREAVDHSPRAGVQILLNRRGLPWTSDGFRTSWRKLCAKAAIKGLTFHDLRGSAVVRLALAGATVPEIATITGHGLKDVETILDKHYLGRDVRLAESGIRKLERKEKRTRSVKGR